MGSILFGRQAEQSVIDELLQGGSGALVVRGEAGVGKSALLEYAGAAARARVLRVAGVESEADLPFAALHRLLRPVLDEVEALPQQQANALRAALGLGDVVHGDRFLVGLATLGLLVELSAASPVVCLVDDTQWLDGESSDALQFAARRLHAEPVIMLFASRNGWCSGDDCPAWDLPELRPGCLNDEAARTLLHDQASDLPPAVRDQIVAEAMGNPLALIELPRMLTAEQRRGALVLPPFSPGAAQPVTDRVLMGFRARIAALPEATRSCLLVSALEHIDELDVLAHAIGLLGASLEDFAVAERAGLVGVGPDGVTFRHPLVRTAVLLACDIAARMDAHRALAAAVDADRRAWHLAAAALGPDEELAEQLETVALRARQRGGQAAVSATYARAAELSTEPGEAVRRWTAAAEAATEAGLWQRAGELVDRARRQAEAATPTGDVLAQLAYVRAKLELRSDRPLAAVRLMHEGAEAADDMLARLSLVALGGYYTWASAAHPDQLALARRSEEMCPEGEGLPTTVRAANRALRILVEGTPATAADFVIPADHLPPELRYLIAFQDLARAGAHSMFERATGLVEECRAEGRLGRMPQAMTLLAIAQLFNGRHQSARATATTGMALASDVGQPMWRGYLAGVHAWLSAVSGAEAECISLTEQAIRDADHRAWMPAACWAEYSRVILDLGWGRYDSVLDRVDQAMTGPTRHAFLWWYSWPDYIEAAVRLGDSQRGHDRLKPLADWVEGTGQAAALAILHRARALLAPDSAAGELFERSLALHAEHRQPYDEARTRLVYGEWLRRNRRRVDARPQLQAAMETFDRLGAAVWSDRAAAELRATGHTVPNHSRVSDPLIVLTPQELQVVRLAVTGASNRQIGAQLFLSPRTVAYHLYKAFPKLGITSRAELARLVS
ncbi:helix-turn-helix transcriptional regulator [Nocardia lijiangensis]|uniref:helix-turn-helix transcriptional regulator n=1 Tax=Nocardia lijiangensis TaxID=299618 RepID=UPI000830073E|nr:LuxR family transcriptional regulator [Nocardia lijiangensis]